jgi:hypothetical protein
MVLENGSIESRVDGETHQVTLNGAIEYRAPGFSARLDADTLEVLDAAPSGEVVDGAAFSLEPAADMWVLLKGLSDSMAHLPAMAETGTRLSHPGYEE